MKKSELRKIINKLIQEQFGDFPPDPLGTSDCEGLNLVSYIVSNYDGYYINNPNTLNDWCGRCNAADKVHGFYWHASTGEIETHCRCCPQFLETDYGFTTDPYKPPNDRPDVSFVKPDGPDVSWIEDDPRGERPDTPIGLGGDDDDSYYSSDSAWYCPAGGQIVPITEKDPDPEEGDCVYTQIDWIISNGYDVFWDSAEECMSNSVCSGPTTSFGWFDYEWNDGTGDVLNCNNLTSSDGPTVNYMDGMYDTESSFCLKCQIDAYNFLNPLDTQQDPAGEPFDPVQVSMDEMFNVFNGSWLAWCHCCDEWPFMQIEGDDSYQPMEESIKIRLQELANIRKQKYNEKVMSKKENVKKIKKYIDEVLNTKSSLTAKRPLKQDRLRKSFCTVLYELQFINSRAVGMKHDFNIDFTEYDEPFFRAIEALIKLRFNDKQRSMINWWLYDKFLPSGDVLVLNDNETHEEIPTETPEDIWDLLEKLKLKDEEKNSD